MLPFTFMYGLKASATCEGDVIIEEEEYLGSVCVCVCWEAKYEKVS